MDVDLRPDDINRFARQMERVTSEADPRIQTNVEDACEKIYWLVEKSLRKLERPVYCLSVPRVLQTDMGPTIQVYIFHEQPEIGDNVAELDKTTCEVLVDFTADPHRGTKGPETGGEG